MPTRLTIVFLTQAALLTMVLVTLAAWLTACGCCTSECPRAQAVVPPGLSDTLSRARDTALVNSEPGKGKARFFGHPRYVIPILKKCIFFVLWKDKHCRPPVCWFFSDLYFCFVLVALTMPLNPTMNWKNKPDCNCFNFFPVSFLRIRSWIFD